jgi:hypothetical protein
MKTEELYEILIPKERNLEVLVNKAINDNQIAHLLINELNNTNAKIKYGCLNTLVLISEISPNSLYEFFGVFLDLLNSDKKVFKLGAIKILCNLSLVDDKEYIETQFDKLFSFINKKELTPASNLIKGSKVIIQAKPELVEKIINEILKIEKNEYETAECKEILRGQAIDLFYNLFEKLPLKEKIKNFVMGNLNSNRASTKKKAEKFIDKYK